MDTLFGQQHRAPESPVRESPTIPWIVNGSGRVDTPT